MVQYNAGDKTNGETFKRRILEIIDVIVWLKLLNGQYPIENAGQKRIIWRSGCKFFWFFQVSAKGLHLQHPHIDAN